MQCTKKKWVRWACMSLAFYVALLRLFHNKNFCCYMLYGSLSRTFPFATQNTTPSAAPRRSRLRHILTYFFLWSLILSVNSSLTALQSDSIFLCVQKSINHAACYALTSLSFSTKRRTRRIEKIITEWCGSLNGLVHEALFLDIASYNIFIMS